MLTDDELAGIVNSSRCDSCDGNGFRRVRAEDVTGETVPGVYDYLDCGACKGNGIKLRVCYSKVLALEKCAQNP